MARTPRLQSVGVFGTTLPGSHRMSATTIVYEGPFFTKDPAVTFDANAKRLMNRIAQVGEAEVKRRIAAAPRRAAGPSYSAQFVVGRTESLSGKNWKQFAVISAYGGIIRAGLDGAHARRVQASLAGRHNAEIRRAFTARGLARMGTSLGTTPGHEGRAHVFARTRASLKRVASQYARDLLEGVA